MLVVEEFGDVTRCPDERRADSGGRITSREVKERLDEMVQQSKMDATYYLRSKPMTEFKRPRRSVISFRGTPEELKGEISAIHGQVKATMEAEQY